MLDDRLIDDPGVPPAGDGAGRTGPLPVLELTGESTPIRVLLRDLVRQRHLVPMLASKDFHARYRSATFGVLWSVLLPLLQGAVLAVVFTRVVRIPISGGDSYPIFVIAGTVSWSYFQMALTAGSTSIVDQGGIAGKVYFPRLVLPAVSAASSLIGFGISMGVTLLLMFVFGASFHITLPLLIPALVLEALLVILLSAPLALAHVYFRDVRYIVQAALLVVFYAAPVIYPLDRPHGALRAIVILNPMTGVIQLVRYAIFGHALDLGLSLLWTGTVVVLLVVLTLLAYRRFERVACDRL
jgi:ABC-type polysaccharide/polyol phosphate export permease